MLKAKYPLPKQLNIWASLFFGFHTALGELNIFKLFKEQL